MVPSNHIENAEAVRSVGDGRTSHLRYTCCCIDGQTEAGCDCRSKVVHGAEMKDLLETEVDGGDEDASRAKTPSLGNENELF